ncbi:microfibril-associated glycoprotein 4-like [Cochliomyia hominivorax]
MVLNILVLNLVISIFITGTNCNNGGPISHTKKNITSFHYINQHHDYYSPIVNLQNLRKSLFDLNSKLNSYVYRYCSKTIQRTVRPIFDIRYDILPEECNYAYYDIPINCAEATACTYASGIYYIYQEQFSNQPFLVWCDAVTQGGDWTVIQRRHDGSENFERFWLDYVNGFGEVQGEFFIGLEKLHVMTNFNGPQELLVILRDHNETKYARYDNFVVGSKHEHYTLFHVGDYIGNAGDSLKHHLKQKFSTLDKDNDEMPDYSCPLHLTGGWWYKDCHLSNLNGKYGDHGRGKGINWFTFRGWQYSIPYVKMMIRRRTY